MKISDVELSVLNDAEISFSDASHASYEDYLIMVAQDHLGAAVRDNNRHELIHIGLQIENGTWED